MSRRDQGPDWVNIYFGWKIFFIVFHYVKAVITFLILAPCVIAIVGTVIWFPDYTSDVITGCFAVFGALFVGSILWLIGLGIYRIFVPKKRKVQPDWAPPGALANPPGPWYHTYGNPLWQKTEQGWVRSPDQTPEATSSYSSNVTDQPRILWAERGWVGR